MKLQEIFDQLTYGDLSQISIGANEAGIIDESNWDRVLAHINLGLTALYKRFNLKEGRLVLELQPEQTLYRLHSDFTVSKNLLSQPVKYIKDTLTEPFQDDLLKVERVYTEAGHEFSLNDETDPYSMMTLSHLLLKVPTEVVEGSMDLPDALKTTQLEVVYRAKHRQLVQGNGYFDPERIEIDLPESHLEALLYFIASRVNNPIGMSNEFHAGNSYAAKYEMVCQQLEQSGLQINQGANNIRLARNGWV